jgi:hypothetical protein
MGKLIIKVASFYGRSGKRYDHGSEIQAQEIDVKDALRRGIIEELKDSKAEAAEKAKAEAEAAEKATVNKNK